MGDKKPRKWQIAGYEFAGDTPAGWEVVLACEIEIDENTKEHRLVIIDKYQQVRVFKE